MVQIHVLDPEGTDIRKYELLLQDAGGRKAGIRRKAQITRKRLSEKEEDIDFLQEEKEEEGKEITGNDQDT